MDLHAALKSCSVAAVYFAAQQRADIDRVALELAARIQRDAAPGRRRMRNVLGEREFVEMDARTCSAPTRSRHRLPLAVGGQMTERLLEIRFGHRRESSALTNTGRARVWAQHDAAVVQDLVDEVVPRQLAA